MNEDKNTNPENPLSEDDIIWVEIEKGDERAFHLISADTTDDGRKYAIAVPADDSARLEEQGLRVILFRMEYNEETGKDEIVPPYLDEDAMISLEVRMGDGPQGEYDEDEDDSDGE